MTLSAGIWSFACSKNSVMSEIIQITGKPAMFGKIENGHMPEKYKKINTVESRNFEEI